MYVEVLIPLSLNGSFTYKSSQFELHLGSFVRLDFKGKELVGIVVKIIEDPENIKYKVKEIEELLNIEPVSESYINFLRWVADYNIVPIGLVLKSGLIKELEALRYFKLSKTTKKLKKLLELFQGKEILDLRDLTEAKLRKSTIDKLLDEGILSEVGRAGLFTERKLEQINLSDEQQSARDQIKPTGFYVYLLDGVTGSGKTSIYLNTIIEILNKSASGQALVILPEISLSMYISSKIKSHFDEGIVVEWHSRLGPSKRTSNWHKIVSGQARIIIGARSGIFLPIPDLKIIVVDEEHDGSFKQDQSQFTYNARDLAIVRAKILDIPVILSSATPSLESIYNAESGKYTHLQLKKRFGGAEMPEISIVDMRGAKKVTKYISEDLYKKVKDNIQQKMQSLIFLNRRGYSALLLCQECGNRIQCQNCSTWMVQHRRKKVLLCHLCGFETQIPKSCKSCNSEKLISFGPGVEKIEEEIKQLFPEQKILIISSDSQNPEDLQLIEENKIDIIIGTQIISKGYDFSHLSLLAIIDSDASVHGGDLRSGEKNFQILQQVIGRVGRRKNMSGNVVLQTYSPESFLIQSLKNYDRDLFYKNELNSRKSEFMPPFSKLAAIIISGHLIEDVLLAVKTLQKNTTHNLEIQVLGPAPAPIEILNKKHRYRLLFVYKKNFKIQSYVRKIISSIQSFKKVSVYTDIDPINFL